MGFVAAGALVIVASLSGCGAAQIGQSLVTERIVTSQLTSMVDEIESVSPGIVAHYTNEITGSYSFVVDVQVAADVLTPATTVAIITPVLAAFNSSPLSNQQLNFELTAADGGVFAIGVFDLSAATVAAEVDYWFGLSTALDLPVSMDLVPSDGFDAPYLRAIAMTAAHAPLTRVAWDAARGVPDPSPAISSWSLPGIDASGTLPPEAVTNLLMSLPDQNAIGAEMIHLGWDGTAGSLSLSLFSEAKGNRHVVVHLEPCGASIPAEPDLVGDLAASGVILPPGAGVGVCASS